MKNNNEANTANQLIRKLNLKRHPEGGFYQQTHKSKNIIEVNHKIYGTNHRSAGTSIVYLFPGNDFSAWHRVKSDEVWYYHLGSSITIHILVPHTREYFTSTVGNPLVSVSPGFEYEDFELADTDSLLHEFPGYEELIRQFGRQDSIPTSCHNTIITDE